MWVFPKIGVSRNGKPYEHMDDLGGKPLFLETPMYFLVLIGRI